MKYVFLAVAGVLSALLVASCGSGSKRVASSTTLSAGTPPNDTARLTTTEQRVTTVALPTTVATTETQPATTVATTRVETVLQPETVVQTATLTQTATVVQTETTVQTTAAPTTTGVSAGAAAVAGAAAASKNTETTSETPWGWIAFGILAVAVVTAGIIWWVRRRHQRSRGVTDGYSSGASDDQ